MKYIIYKDYLTGQHRIGYEYMPIEAKTDFEAIEAAEKAETYTDDGWKKQRYKAVMCKRSDAVGWHANTTENAESEHHAYRCYKKDLEYFAAVYEGQ